MSVNTIVLPTPFIFTSVLFTPIFTILRAGAIDRSGGLAG